MADRASGREGNDGGGDSNTLGRRDYRPTPGRTSATSFLCFLLSEFCEPRIFRRGGFGVAEIELGALGRRDGRPNRSPSPPHEWPCLSCGALARSAGF